MADIRFLQSRHVEAKHDYQIASVLNPKLTPAKAMVRVIRGPEPARAAVDDRADIDRRIQLAVLQQKEEEARASKAHREAEEALATQRKAEAASKVADANRAQQEFLAKAELARQARLAAEASAARTAEAQDTKVQLVAGSSRNYQSPPPKTDTDRLVQAVNQEIGLWRLLEYGANALPIAAAILFEVELGPVGWAAGIAKLASMAGQDWDKVKKNVAQAGR